MKPFKPTRYELAIAGKGVNKEFQLRLYATGLAPGVPFSVIGGTRCNPDPAKYGGCLPGLRKEGRKMAKYWKVNFVDLTTEPT